MKPTEIVEMVIKNGIENIDLVLRWRTYTREDIEPEDLVARDEYFRGVLNTTADFLGFIVDHHATNYPHLRSREKVIDAARLYQAVWEAYCHHDVSELHKTCSKRFCKFYGIED